MAYKKYSMKERQAYWVGVGISAARFGGEEKLLGSKNKKIRNSIINGYQADSKKDISKKFER